MDAVTEAVMSEADDSEEMRKLFNEMAQEEKLPVRERGQRRADRIIGRSPGLLKVAARKALAGETLSEDEFVLTHKGFLPDEWTEEMESEWRVCLVRDWEDWIR
jgi:hypothetical protein